MIEALKAAGATDIYAVELSPERQEKAKELGAIIIDPSKRTMSLKKSLNAQTAALMFLMK